MVATDEVYFAHAGKMSRKILNIGHWIPVRHCGIIEAPVVPIQTPTTRSFWNHVQRGLDDLLTILMSSILSNSALAMASFSGDRRRVRAWMSVPLAVMKCSTVCLVGDCKKLGVVMSGNCASSESYWSVEVEIAPR